VDINKEDVSDNMANFVWEPAVMKINAITAASEAACMILSVDETVKNASSQKVRMARLSAAVKFNAHVWMWMQRHGHVMSPNMGLWHGFRAEGAAAGEEGGCP
jgi:hypothetical protein